MSTAGYTGSEAYTASDVPETGYDITGIDVETIRPFNDRVIVRMDYIHRIGRFAIPETGRDRPVLGTVVRIGESVTRVKPGDVVLMSRLGGVWIKNKGDDPANPDAPVYQMHKEDNLMGVLEKLPANVPRKPDEPRRGPAPAAGGESVLT